VPVTVTDSEKITWTAIVEPALYEPLPVLDVTLETVGAVVSITSAALAPSEPAAPGATSVKVAAFPPLSLIVPPLRALVD
jgi:hypothetical protein